MTPDTVITGPTSGERRKVAPGSPPPRLWDPDGAPPAAIGPALWNALHEAVLATQAEWERSRDRTQEEALREQMGPGTTYEQMTPR